MKKSLKNKSPKQNNSKKKVAKKAKAEQEEVKAKTKAKTKAKVKSKAKSPLLNKDKDKEKSKNKKQPVQETKSQSSKKAKAKKPAKVKEIIEEVMDDLAQETTDDVVSEEAVSKEEDVLEENESPEPIEASEESEAVEEIEGAQAQSADEENDVSEEQASVTESDEAQPDSQESLMNQIEALVFSSGVPLSVDKIIKTFDENKPTLGEVRECLLALAEHYQHRGVNLVEVATGWRFEVARKCAPTIVKTMTEKPSRLSRAFLETLALIAYRQPITRAEIEAIRGVVVSTQMIKTLLDHEWIRVVGHKDVPGKPALYATTKTFLDDMGLKKLDDLPPLAEIKAMLPNESDNKQAASLEEITQQMAEIKVESEEVEVNDFSEFIKVDVPLQQRVEVAQDEMNVNFDDSYLDCLEEHH